ncbi:hypothetical protein LCGC14_1492240 [marine sediment metagenome]|uniref:Uncharacterized protein n=1 Tax=marine sediment metagenome TaxID=412755 RepID=A0A0F9LLX3_9ZZZZ
MRNRSMATPPEKLPELVDGTAGKDAAPVRKRKYPKLVQAWVTKDLRNRIQQHADHEQISVGAYIRRTLNNAVPGGA